MKKLTLLFLALISIGITAQKRKTTKHYPKKTIEKKAEVTEIHDSITAQNGTRQVNDYPIASNYIPEKPDIQADFPGGNNAFRQAIANNFDSSKVNIRKKGKISTSISFVVEKDGTLSNIRATGPENDLNQEAIRTVQSIKTLWTPAKSKGQIVRCIFRLPLSMNFE